MLFINPEIFLTLAGGVVKVWSYRDRREFELDAAHTDRLLSIARNEYQPEALSEVDQNLIGGNLIATSPYEMGRWPWAYPSHIFQVYTSDPYSIMGREEADQFWTDYIHHSNRVAASLPDFPVPGVENWVELPRDAGTLMYGSLKECLERRRTVREFLPQPIELAQLGTLLHFAFGNQAHRAEDIPPHTPEAFTVRRTSPSGGGLAATDIYVAVQHVDGLQVGTYFYDPVGHRLGLVAKGPGAHELGAILAGHHFANDVAVGIWLVARLDKVAAKYSADRALRVALIEAGHLSQTFLLLATSMGLGTWLTGAFQDSAIRSLLQIGSEQTPPLLFVAAGASTGATLDPGLAALVERIGSESGGVL
jgi:SagB-type dehydrogenase family enzyme